MHKGRKDTYNAECRENVVFVHFWHLTAPDTSRLTTFCALEDRDLRGWWYHLGTGEPGHDMCIDFQQQWCIASAAFHMETRKDIVE
jgi:nicotinamidase-related amidase